MMTWSQIKAEREQKMQALVKAVREHAETNYEQGGWDFVVECWEDADIMRDLNANMTPEQAIAKVAEVVKIKDEQRKDAEAEIF